MLNEEDELPTEESLRLLNQALMSPEGDMVITISSYDRDMLRDMWSLQQDGTEFSEQLVKSGDDIGRLVIVVKGLADAGMLYALKSVLDFLKSRLDPEKGRHKARIRYRKFHIELGKFVMNYEDSIDIELDDEADDKSITSG